MRKQFIKWICFVSVILFNHNSFCQDTTPLEKKFPTNKQVFSIIKDFPALEKLLLMKDPWKQEYSLLVKGLFGRQLQVTQASGSIPLIFDGIRTKKWVGELVWQQHAYETEVYTLDPVFPVIRFHLGRPLDVRLHIADYPHPDSLKQLYPVLEPTVPEKILNTIKNLVKGLEPYGAYAIPSRHKRIHAFILPGGTKMTFSDFSGTGIGSVYIQIDLQPAQALYKRGQNRLPAFPGAEGYGAYTIGGRGGRVFIVTSLEDYLPGNREGRKEGSLGEAEVRGIPPVLPSYPSLPKEAPIKGTLREAVEAKGPRIVVFAVSGTIELKNQLEIRNPYLTLVGNTAPGEGVQIRNWGISVKTHDVVLRYLRIRVGDIKGPGKMPRVLGDQTDAIDINGANIIVDHCDFAYANDQVVNIYGLKRNHRSGVSFQWNYVYGGLLKSTHEKGVHSMSYFLTGWGYVSMHHNLTAHTLLRNPRAWGVWLDYRNNVLHDYIGAGYTESPSDYLKLNYIGNYLKHGLDTTAFRSVGECEQFYQSGNVVPPLAKHIIAAEPETFMDTPFSAPFVTTTTATEAYDQILKNGGASLPVRDLITNYVAETTKAGKESLVTTTSSWPSAGYPAYLPARALPDSDSDGMPDEWEKKYGLNPHSASDASLDKDKDGYTNIEEFINGTRPDVKDGQPHRVFTKQSKH
jgi:pectate lyase